MDKQASPPDNQEKILIVDDDPTILDLLANYIEFFGFQHDTARDGVEALEKIGADRFTVVLTDIMMPRLDGMQLLKKIKEDHHRIDVIVITGYASTFSYTDVIRAGASDFISKPFNADELEAKLNRIFRERRLLRQLERHSNIDALTDLYNRRHFDTKLRQEAQRAQRQGYPIFVAMLDIDKFKGYNDKYGHQAGDRLLQSLGSILRHCVREHVDWAFRYGGDEFSIILTQLTAEQAVLTADRIRKKYQQEDFPGTGISLGIAQMPPVEGDHWEEALTDLVARADRALYTAKRDEAHGHIVLDALPAA